MTVPDTYYCGDCGKVYVLDLDQAVRCVSAHHCHVGEKIVADDGRYQWVKASKQCRIVAANPERTK